MGVAGATDVTGGASVAEVVVEDDPVEAVIIGASVDPVVIGASVDPVDEEIMLFSKSSATKPLLA